MIPRPWLQRFLALGAALVYLAPAQVRAEPRNDFTTSASVGVLVTDNVRNTSSAAAQSDVALTYDAGVEFARRFAAGRATLGAGITGALYNKADELNDPLANVNGELEVPFGGRLILTLSDRFTPSAISFVDTDVSRFNTTQTNRARASLYYSIPLASAWRAYWRAGGERLDVFDTNDVFAPGADPDRWTLETSLELERRLGRRSSLVFTASVAHVFFDDLIYNPGAPPLIPAAFEDADYTQVSGGTSWHYRPRRQFSLTAGGGVLRYFADTRAGGDTSATGFGELVWEPTGRTRVRLHGQLQRSSELSGLSYKIADGLLEAEHKLTRRLTWKARALLRHLYGSGTNAAQDNLFSAGTSLAFAMGRHFSLSAAYDHTRAGPSGLSGSSYSRNTGTLSLGAQF